MSICTTGLRDAWYLLEGDVVLVWKSPDSKAISSCRPSSLHSMEEICAKMSDWNCFLVLNQTRRDGKPRIADITKVRWMMLDFDPKDVSRVDWAFPYDELTGLLAQFGVSFHYGCPVVQSGRGIQIWVPVEQGDTTVADCHAAFKVIGKRVAELFTTNVHWKFDTTCADVSRIVRCPGTTNTRSGRMATIAVPPEHERWERGGTIRLSDIAIPDPPPTPSPLPQATWAYLAPRLHQFNLAFLLAGTSTKAESRHGRLYNCAKELFDVGVVRGRALSLLEHGANMCSPNLLKDDPHCVERVVDQLWKMSCEGSI